jgi:hypothetical protein
MLILAAGREAAHFRLCLRPRLIRHEVNAVGTGGARGSTVFVALALVVDLVFSTGRGVVLIVRANHRVPGTRT